MALKFLIFLLLPCQCSDDSYASPYSAKLGSSSRKEADLLWSSAGGLLKSCGTAEEAWVGRTRATPGSGSPQ